METHSRDGAAEKPVDKRWPLVEVMFRGPTKVESGAMVTVLEAGTMRLVEGREWHPPAMWYDPTNRLIYVGEWTYPLEMVHRFKRAKMAITRKPKSLDIDKFTIGKK